jgi:putative DNA primase/helicase
MIADDVFEVDARLDAAWREEASRLGRHRSVMEAERVVAEAVTRFNERSIPVRDPWDLIHAGLRTDFSNAERLVARHGNDLRFVPNLGWLVWDGKRWSRDLTGEVQRRAKESIRHLHTEALDIEDGRDRRDWAKWALISESETRLRAAVKLAETEEPVVVTADRLDNDPMLLTVANGTVDLRSGLLREARRDDLITKLAPVTYRMGASSAVWDRFLASATGDDVELQAFLQRAAGYTLTGRTSEEVMFLIHGAGATGKSTFLEALISVLGDYAATADFETFLKRPGAGGVRNDVARLQGKRMVVSLEVDEDRALSEGLVKALTGGDRVTARFLYQEAFEFQPQFTLWLAVNHAPKVSHTDEGMWRRIRRVPFDHVVPSSQRDPALKAALRDPNDVGSAILAWAVEGCLAWQRSGLGSARAVKKSTERYRHDMDPLAPFIDKYCVLTGSAWTTAEDLRTSYEGWCRNVGADVLTVREFAELLRRRGCEQGKRYVKGKQARIWQGIGQTNPRSRSRNQQDARRDKT